MIDPNGIRAEDERLRKQDRAVSLVRENLLTVKGYAPYCGNYRCRGMPRTTLKNGQFQCGSCGWRSQFEPEFIRKVKEFNQ